MTNEEIRAYCGGKTGAYEDFPFGAVPVCFKVCGKLFLQLYPERENHKITVSCEPMLADFYRMRYPGDVAPGYHCPDRLKPYMNTVYVNRGVPDGIVFEMMEHSYQRVAEKLTKWEKETLTQLEELR